MSIIIPFDCEQAFRKYQAYQTLKNSQPEVVNKLPADYLLKLLGSESTYNYIIENYERLYKKYM